MSVYQNEKTNGKLDKCFQKQFGFEATNTPVTLVQMRLICGSLNDPARVQFNQFGSCAAEVWDKNLDKILEKIWAARRHAHSKQDATSAVTHEESDDELKVIKKVVSSSIDTPFDQLDVKMIDFSPPKTTIAPVVVLSAIPATVAPSAPGPAKPPVASLPVGGNAVEIKGTTVGPVVVINSSLAPNGPVKVTTSVKPAVVEAAKQAVNGAGGSGVTVVVPPTPSSAAIQPPPVVLPTTVAPLAAAGAPSVVPAGVAVSAPGIEIKVAPSNNGPTTARPLVTVTSLAPAVAVAVGVVSTIAPSSVKPKVEVASDKIRVPSVAGGLAISAPNATAEATSVKESLKKLSTIDKKILNDPNTVVVFVDEQNKPTTTRAPSIGDIILKTVAGPSNATEETKPSSSSTTSTTTTTTTTTTTASPTKGSSDKEAEKKKDLIDAKKTIEALKLQRAKSHHSAADARLHQIEHEHQMSIDPVGHTIKHRIYEMKKAGLKP